MEYIVEMKDITKRFQGTCALDNISFSLQKGEVHALMGENGAGKSTFIKVMTGVYIPEQGEMYHKGERVFFHQPRDAQKRGIAAIYQHATSYPHMSVTENIFLGHELRYSSGRLNWKEMKRRSEELLLRLGANFHENALMGSLRVAQQQIVEIAKALSMDIEVLIMDEPTAALSQRESEELYRVVDQLKEEGYSIILISHRFEDMYRLASRVTVLRDAHYIGTWNIEELSQEELIVAMVGRKVDSLFPKESVPFGAEVLRVENLSREGAFSGISFSIRRGEILVITGLVGSGRTELCESIFGLEPADQGSLVFMGNPVSLTSPKKAMQLGIGLLPEDRQKQGLVLDWSIAWNITLSEIFHIHNRGVINQERENSIAQGLYDRVGVKAQSIHAPASSLSGGNQQKVVFAKLLTSDLKLLILDEPTKGIDVGSKSDIYHIIGELAKAGIAVIMVSSEMPEVLGLADTIVVLKEGTMSASMNIGEASQEKILAAAMGGGNFEVKVGGNSEESGSPAVNAKVESEECGV